jgi:iron-sulfur cluster repair protein YtfE (RIC family)
MTPSVSLRPDTSDMAAVHKVFRTSLSSAPQFVTSAQGDDERRGLIANYYANLMALLETHHESEEALLFPLLIERANEHKTILEATESQHAGMVALLHETNDKLNSWAKAGDSQSRGVVSSLLALDAVLSAHLDQEEQEVVPLAGEYMTAEEWGKLPGHSLGNFTGDKVWLILGLVRENFTQAQRDAMLEHMPPPARQMWESTGEQSFNDLIAEVRQSS